MSGRINVEKPNNTPAPGAYEPEKAMEAIKPAPPSFTMRPKTGMDKVDNTPAPNQYKPEDSLRATKENMPSYPFGIRPEIKVLSETPGKLISERFTLGPVWSLEVNNLLHDITACTHL